MSVYTEIKSNRMFKGISDIALNFFVSHASITHFKSNHVLIHEGDRSDSIYLIFEGHCEVRKIDHETGMQHLIAVLAKGDPIGEISLIDTKKRSASVHAKTNGILCGFSMQDIDKFAELYPKDYIILIKNLSRVLSDRLRGVNEVAAQSLTAKLKSATLQIKMGDFIVILIGMLCIYSYLLALTSVLVQESETDFFVSSFILITTVIPIIFFIKHEKYNFSKFGVNAHHWKKNIIISFLLTLPLLGVSILLKMLMIKTVPVFQNSVLFNGSIITHKNNAYLMLALYMLSCPIQEFIARGVFQSSLQKFLIHKSSTAIIILTSLIYSTFHLYLSVSYALATFIPGLLFGWLYARQKSLLGPIVSHTIFGVFCIYILGVHGLILK